MPGSSERMKMLIANKTDQQNQRAEKKDAWR